MSSPRPIAVLFALPEESGEFRRALGPATGVVVEHTGMGPAAAGEKTRRLLSQLRPAAVISAGFAGGLQLSAKVGAVICDLRGHPGTVPAGCLEGQIVSQDHVLETAFEKAALGKQTGALAVDMETEAIAAAVHEYSATLPVYALRTISDPVSSDLPVPMPEWFDQARQRPRPAHLVWYLLRHPRRIAPFARFVRGLSPARRALAQALLEFTAALRRAGEPSPRVPEP